MSKNCYSEINLHIVWHTKQSMPLLTPTLEPLAHQFLESITDRAVSTIGWSE